MIYYLNMPFKDPEQRKLYMIEYREANKKKIKDQRKEHYQTEVGKKVNRVSKWKQIGVKCDNFDELYDKYINCENCEECNIELIQGIFGANKRCLDHDHETGKFRNVLCHLCNVRRG
jgi:hypothetical protein